MGEDFGLFEWAKAILGIFIIAVLPFIVVYYGMK